MKTNEIGVKSQAATNEIWREYGRALVPAGPPHLPPDPDLPALREALKKSSAHLARWTCGWDLPTEEDFWFVIKDRYVEPQELAPKTRSQLRRAQTKLSAELVDENFNYDSLYETHVAASSRYKRTPLSRVQFLNSIKSPLLDSQRDIWVVRSQDGSVAGFQLVRKYEDYAQYSTTNFHPEYFKEGVSYVLIDALDRHYLGTTELRYVSDGARNVAHPTNFQSWLIDNFLWRKAYTRMHLMFALPLAAPIRMLGQFLAHFDQGLFELTRDSRLPMFDSLRILARCEMLSVPVAECCWRPRT